MKAIITTINDEFEKAEYEGHKAYTRVRRGKLERIPQKGVIGKKPERKPFKSYIVEATKTFKESVVNKVMDDLKGLGFTNIKVDDSWPESSDFGSVAFTTDYKNVSIYGTFSHQGHTIYFGLYKAGKAAQVASDKYKLGPRNVPAMSAEILKKKADAILGKKDE